MSITLYLLGMVTMMYAVYESADDLNWYTFAVLVLWPIVIAIIIFITLALAVIAWVTGYDGPENLIE